MSNKLIISLKEKMKREEVKVPRLEEVTGIPQARIYKWLSGVGNPKAEDADKIEKWIKGENIEKIQDKSQTQRDDTEKYIGLLERNVARLEKDNDGLNKRIEELEKKVLECLDEISQTQVLQYSFELQAHDMIIDQFDPDGTKKLRQTFYIKAVERWRDEVKKGSPLESNKSDIQV